MVISHSYVNVYQRVLIRMNYVVTESVVTEFWNDGEWIGGMIAKCRYGSKYVHVFQVSVFFQFNRFMAIWKRSIVLGSAVQRMIFHTGW